MTILEQLKEPFKPSEIHWRVGSTTKDKKKGLALAYLDARNVMKRLDDIFDVTGWSDSYIETQSGRVFCTITVKVGDTWVSKSDAAGDTAVEGQKGAVSDAFKRAAVKLGVGRYLYYLPQEWVAINQYRQIITPPNLPAWALPREQKDA